MKIGSDKESPMQMISISHSASDEDIIVKPATLISVENYSSKTPNDLLKDDWKCSKAEVTSSISDKEAGYEYISRYKVFVVLAAITLTTFLSLLDTTIVATMSTIL